MYFGYGDAYSGYGKHNNHYVRCVRAGQSLRDLSISTVGGESGLIVSWPAAINCGSTCSALFQLNSTVVLSATPNFAGSIFTGWSGMPIVAMAWLP
ncbi:MAG: hypothetical protein MZU95_03815 [Desulfomicrobium escambiense]|nr:hypothetical protein [Desulfomicrobium escambiense]